MKRDTVIPAYKFNHSFLSCEKDAETILRKLFVESKPYSDILKKLLIINNKDCISNEDSESYKKAIQLSIKEMRDLGYIKLEPKIAMPEFEEVKAYIILSFDNFTMNATNPEFRDCIISFDIICHTDAWDIGNFQLRPLKIAGYIDGILDKSKLSGIGELNFMGCNELILNENLSGYTLMYQAVHGSDDRLPEGGGVIDILKEKEDR